MSIINQMLKDLEQRRAAGFDKNPEMLEDLDAASVADAPRPKSSNVWTVFFTFLFIAIAATWLYLSGYLKIPVATVVVKKADVVKVKPPEVVKPEPKKFKSIVQEIPVIEKTHEQEVIAKPLVNELAIASISPSPLQATGNREVITVHGQGFIAPLSVTMEWAAGRAFKELEAWQVRVISENELQLHVNLGKEEDQWRVIIKAPDGEQQVDYSFSVLATQPEIKQIEKVDTEEKSPAALASSFTKTNRVLSNDEQIKIDFAKASLLIQQGRIKAAKQSLREILALDFSHLKARQALAALLFREQAYDEAIEVLELGSIQHPDYAPFTLLLARIYTERGQDPRAIALLENLQPEVSANSEYYALLAALYQRGAQHHKAVTVYKKLLTSFPSRAVWWMGLGLSLQSTQKNKEALQAYNRSLQTQGLTAELRRFIKSRIAQLSS